MYNNDIESERGNSMTNTLYYGDNLPILRAMAAQRVRKLEGKQGEFGL
jgi:hypothetical protein